VRPPPAPTVPPELGVPPPEDAPATALPPEPEPEAPPEDTPAPASTFEPATPPWLGVMIEFVPLVFPPHADIAPNPQRSANRAPCHNEPAAMFPRSYRSYSSLANDPSPSAAIALQWR